MNQMYQLSNIKNKLGFYIAILVVVSNRISMAIDVGAYDPEDPSPVDFVIPFARLFNLLLMIAGAALIIMIVYGAIKLSMALGKPMEFQGAQKTLTYAVVGFAIVVGFFALYWMITGAFGIQNFTRPDSIFEAIQTSIGSFLEAGQVCDGSCF